MLRRVCTNFFSVAALQELFYKKKAIRFPQSLLRIEGTTSGAVSRSKRSRRCNNFPQSARVRRGLLRRFGFLEAPNAARSTLVGLAGQLA